MWSATELGPAPGDFVPCDGAEVAADETLVARQQQLEGFVGIDR
jgi:hypothetical protein